VAVAGVWEGSSVCLPFLFLLKSLRIGVDGADIRIRIFRSLLIRRISRMMPMRPGVMCGLSASRKCSKDIN